MNAPGLFTRAASGLRSLLPMGRMSTPSRDSGAYRGSISNYRVRNVGTQTGENFERRTTQERALDLYANDFAAKSAVNSISTNAVGTGLTPQPRLPWKRLGITEDDAYETKEQMEWLWSEWCAQAQANGSMHFEDLQLAGLRSILKLGELLHLPVQIEPKPANGRTFATALQPLSPLRLGTPADLTFDPTIRDGVHLSQYGQPLGYWLASPAPSLVPVDRSALLSSDFRYLPARIGHRPGVFHIFRQDDEEQVRGVSSLSTGVKLFRNLTDAIDHELLAQVLAASFPVFISLEDGRSGLPPEIAEQMGRAVDDEGERYQTVDPGVIMYGSKNQKPHILESKRPSQNFLGFVELILRAMGASVDMPYEILFKDFSKTNYSSARAALNEAWKTFQLYRTWFVRQYCQPVWNMVQEEAYLRGRLTLPGKGLGFYEALPLWTSCYWYGPSRGYVDPVKEITATIQAIDNRLMTRTKAWAEMGEDFDDGVDTMRAEEIRMGELLPKPDPAPGFGAKKDAGPDEDDPENSDNSNDDEADNAKSHE